MESSDRMESEDRGMGGRNWGGRGFNISALLRLLPLLAAAGLLGAGAGSALAGGGAALTLMV